MSNCRPRPRASGEAGFALLEVLVALAILSVGLVAVLTSLRSSSELVETSARVFAATTIAEGVLDAYVAGVSDVAGVAAAADGFTCRTVSSVPTGFDSSVLIGPLMEKGTGDEPGVNPIRRLEMIEATAAWQRRGRTHSVLLEELVLVPAEDPAP